MKRQGSSTGGQPPVNKPDASTDLRSKIGAKLQTLLNGLDTDSVLYAKRRKQLYDDLFGKPKYSEIIIDPTIVIKEEPDVEECSSDSSTLLNSQNFLLSAKSRLTELLNKQQDGGNKYKDSGKENALFSNRNKSSSSKSMILQSPSCSKSPSILYNSLNKKRISTSKEHTNSSSDSTNHEDPAKNLVVVLEDCMKSNIRTKSSRTKHAGSNIISSNVGSNFVRKQDKHLTLDNLVNKKDNIGGLRSTRRSKPCENTSECCFIEDNSEICRTKPAEFVLSTDTSSLKMGHDILQSTAESLSDIPYYNEDEMVDDPIIPQVIVDIKVGEVISADGNCNFEMENSDSDVELLCEKERTAEVITLEDNDYEIVKDREALGHKKGNAAAGSGFIHVCKQCGKSFRAFSLLNFHIKMHGKLSQSPSSSSQSFS